MWIILEDASGVRRKIAPGKMVWPPRRPDEKIIGVEGSRTMVFRHCFNCGQKGVYEST